MRVDGFEAHAHAPSDSNWTPHVAACGSLRYAPKQRLAPAAAAGGGGYVRRGLQRHATCRDCGNAIAVNATAQASRTHATPQSGVLCAAMPHSACCEAEHIVHRADCLLHAGAARALMVRCTLVMMMMMTSGEINAPPPLASLRFFLSPLLTPCTLGALSACTHQCPTRCRHAYTAVRCRVSLAALETLHTGACRLIPSTRTCTPELQRTL